MARSFNGTSDGIQTPTLNLSIYPYGTISFWLNWTTFANNDKLACELTVDYGANAGGFLCDPNSTGPSAGSAYFGYCTVSSAQTVTAEFTRPSAGAWHNWICLIDTTQSNANVLPAVYIDGISQSLTHTNTGGFQANFANAKLNFMCRNQASLFGAGSMADFVFYNALLSPAEAQALAMGRRPNQVRPLSLKYWWTLDGYGHPALDRGFTHSNGVLTGTSFAPGPPLINPAPIIVSLPDPTNVMPAMPSPPPPQFVLMPQIVM